MVHFYESISITCLAERTSGHFVPGVPKEKTLNPKIVVVATGEVGASHMRMPQQGRRIDGVEFRV